MKRSFFIGLIGWIASLPLLANPVLPDDLDAFIEREMEAWRLPGLAIAVVHDDKVILAKGYGVRQVGKPAKVDADTVFAIGSTSKAFTAAAIGSLVDAGKLRWDTPVVQVWPDFRLSDEWITREIRVSDLLANRSGLSLVSEAIWYGTGYERAEIVRRLALVPFDEGFRYQFQYRNTMFLLAGELIPRVDGRTWDDYLRDVFFRPLGMKRTYASEVQLGNQVQNIAWPHIIGYDGKPVSFWYRKMHNIGPAGSIFSSVRDLGQWLRLQLGGGSVDGRAYLKPETMAMMHRSHTPMAATGPAGETVSTPVELLSYALGWVTESYRGVRVVWHNGGIDGMSAWVGMVPGKRLGVAILSNLDECDLRRAIFYKIIDHLVGGTPIEQEKNLVAKQRAFLAERDKAEEQWKALEAKEGKPALPLTAYAGRYRNPIVGEVTVKVEKGRLVLDRTPEQTLRLLCEDGNRFLGKYLHPIEDLRSGKTPYQFDTEGDRVTALVEAGMMRYDRVAE